MQQKEKDLTRQDRLIGTQNLAYTAARKIKNPKIVKNNRSRRLQENSKWEKAMF